MKLPMIQPTLRIIAKDTAQIVNPKGFVSVNGIGDTEKIEAVIKISVSRKINEISPHNHPLSKKSILLIFYPSFSYLRIFLFFCCNAQSSNK